MDGNHVVILGLIWSIILHFQVSAAIHGYTVAGDCRKHIVLVISSIMLKSMVYDGTEFKCTPQQVAVMLCGLEDMRLLSSTETQRFFFERNLSRDQRRCLPLR